MDDEYKRLPAHEKTHPVAGVGFGFSLWERPYVKSN